MRCWIIDETMTPCPLAAALADSRPFAAVLSPEEWETEQESLAFGLDPDPGILPPEKHVTKAEVSSDALTGSFSIPDRENICGRRMEFRFVLDQRGVVFIDQEGAAAALAEALAAKRKWRAPSLERFLYDFLESIIAGDLPMLERMEERLSVMENEAQDTAPEDLLTRLNDLRGELLDLRTHYDQLLDLGQELQENENDFFKAENLRWFGLFTDRVSRLAENVMSLRDYAAQIRDLYQTSLEVKQNHVMNMLTVVTTVFLPLTLITGWFGMNFVRMPILSKPWGYPLVMVVSVAIVLVCLWWFRKKKLL